MDLIQIDSTSQHLLKKFKKKIDGFVVPRLTKDDKIYLLSQGDDYVAMIYFTLEKSAYINYIHTSQNHRKKGHAEFLVRKVMDEIQSAEKREIDVAILPDCGSDRIFSKLGFQYTGEHEMKYFFNF